MSEPTSEPAILRENRVLPLFMLAVVCLLSSATFAGEPHATEWRAYLGDTDSSQYSPLSQINTKNVSQLEPAWTFHSGIKGQVQCNPLMVNGVLYGATADLTVFALNAETGEELWRYKSPRASRAFATIRGLHYWEEGDDQRILFGAGSLLCAIDAKTGKPIDSFGTNGEVNLKEGYDRDTTGVFVAMTTPGVIFEDLIVVTTRVAEWHPAAPGDIRAFNVRTGEREWIFHTIPHPGEFGYETWPEGAWETAGGANCWAGMSVDEEREMLYVPTGSATYDFYGGDRIGENLFANCLLALNARTGERVWHYQVVRHDLWDRDLPAPPNLLTIEQDGEERDVVAQITKTGHVFVFDRDTGEPIFPIEEVEAPASDLPGEEAWPTQPIPTRPPPFARWNFRDEDVTDVSEESGEEILERLQLTSRGDRFPPPSFEGTVIFPGYDGGGEWGGAAVDPGSGIMYVNSTEMPYLLTMYEIEMIDGTDPDARGKRLYAQNCVFCHGKEMEGDARGIFPPLKDIRGRYTLESLSELVRAGKGKMPGFDMLRDSELTELSEFILKQDDQSSDEVASNRGGPVENGNPGPKPKEPGEATGESKFAHTGYFRFVDAEGFPAVKPPWGTLNAIDLNRGEMLWQVPLGHEKSLTARGYEQTGIENYGGPIATAGGLVFIAATKDGKFRAFDRATGAVLWETELPAAGFATPCTYEIGGRQFVVVAAGGSKLGTPAGDAYVAFALPRTKAEGE